MKFSWFIPVDMASRRIDLWRLVNWWIESQENVPQMELELDASARGSQEACCNQGMTYLLPQVEEIDRTVNSVNLYWFFWFQNGGDVLIQSHVIHGWFDCARMLPAERNFKQWSNARVMSGGAVATPVVHRVDRNGPQIAWYLSYDADWFGI